MPDAGEKHLDEDADGDGDEDGQYFVDASESDQPQIPRLLYSFVSTVRVEFAVDAADMCPHGGYTHHQLVGDLLSAEFGGQQSQNLQFALGYGFD